MKFTFVILHYKVIDETIKCVVSIKEKIQQPVDIVIVDNASPNNSGNELLSMYKEDDHVDVLLNESNLGFANGNNVGIHYARNVLKSDFVIVLNNDTYLVQDDFLDVVLAEWSFSHFAVMGPKVYTFSGENQNPMPCKITTRKDVDRLIRGSFCCLILVYLGLDNIYKKIKEQIKKVMRLNGSQLNKALDDLRQENVKLHGCCYVFSPVFFEHFDGFDPRTFMYAEEDVLYAHMKNKGLLMVYNPKLEIFHAEMAATKASSKNIKKMKLFRLRESIKSLKILKDVLENG